MFDGLSDAIADLQTEDELLDSKIDLKQAKLLENPIVIDGVEYATVEAALIALCAHAGSFDSALSSTSENAVQNKVVKAAMDEKQGKDLENSITIDGTTYTTVETALVAILAHIPAVDSVLSGSSTNPIQNKAVYDGLALKQDKTLETPVTVGEETLTTVQAALAAIALALAQTQTIDTALDTSSTNPVQNKAIAEAVNAKQGKTLDTARSFSKHCFMKQNTQLCRCFDYNSLGWEDPFQVGKGNPLGYSCLGNPIQRNLPGYTVHGVTKESDLT
jgi:hypothetical protein